jgi:GTPase SAR1 family protein
MSCCGACCAEHDPFNEGSYEPERTPIARSCSNTGPRKIVLLGASNVGKTYLFHRLQRAPLPSENISTVGANFGTLIRKENEHDKAYLWDTAGM